MPESKVVAKKKGEKREMGKIRNGIRDGKREGGDGSLVSKSVGRFRRKHGKVFTNSGNACFQEITFIIDGVIKISSQEKAILGFKAKIEIEIQKSLWTDPITSFPNNDNTISRRSLQRAPRFSSLPDAGGDPPPSDDSQNTGHLPIQMLALERANEKDNY
ncbi:hypothetical protein NPIL_72071 [Nephila pilipes]|uniref:Uncharacterized protein n=1 Tax=Nephila pilipes TaxID=299642 RepID=A0A8X6NIJ6_NEPPI|nr:hypothetical protein NPIL_72071 [Nephila pilipes]